MQIPIEELSTIREKLDKIDSKIAKLLRERALEIFKIGQIKKKKKLPLIDHKREKEILENLETEYEKTIFRKIIRESRKIQQL